MSTLPKQIKITIVGKFVMTTINRKNYKVQLEKEGKDKLKAIIEKYNNKPSDFWLNKILKTFTPVVKKDKKVSEQKLIKNKTKKEVKEVKKKIKVAEKAKTAISNVVTSVATNKVEELEKVKEIAPTPVVTERKSSREY